MSNNDILSIAVFFIFIGIIVILFLYIRKVFYRKYSTTGESIAVYTHQCCTNCGVWFRFRYDTATATVNSRGHFRVFCPYCGEGYHHTSIRTIPSKYLAFKDFKESM